MLPHFDKDTYLHSRVIKGHDVLIFRSEEQGTQKLFVGTSKILGAKRSHPLMEEDKVVPCLALYQSIGVVEWRDIHEKLKEVSMNIAAKNAEQKVAGSEKPARRKEDGEVFFTEKQIRAFEKVCGA